MARFRLRYTIVPLCLCLVSRCARKAPPPGKPDLKPPHLQILYPTSSDTLSDTVRLEVQITDQSPLRSVHLLVDGNPVVSDSAVPYEFLWDTSELVDTVHTLHLKATDRWDNEGRSKSLTVFTRNGNEPERPKQDPDIETEPSHEEPEVE